jgi:hypothetical protein
MTVSDAMGLWYACEIIWKKTVVIHNVFKEKKCKTKFLTSLIFKKIK